MRLGYPLNPEPFWFGGGQKMLRILKALHDSKYLKSGGKMVLSVLMLSKILSIKSF